ncbi:nicotinate (nicotinamide) nucleotide adenylyltransferase [Pajaroellobacter abortibovis]|uniref:Probable nicotinate-nucleotide adenylyltransferase n=1 Tax=Pajaroellobacter abortibovis TaxID=1882918 RepID=A0A1L6MYL5_9BACT|nr:nicotinate (nicotinamide) nucleotide adenylyltransferase [Pajaroellobacter abortibovis]APS00644.1 nicotinate (nicotinamide) nucleotide adenylyltransferase [Pajaroellobacter abortibovis]
MKVGFFGGSFNPPHMAHVFATCLLLSTEPLDTILIVPTFKHPFGKPLVPFEHRMRMCEMAMGWMPRVYVSSIELELGGESHTIRTITHLAETHPSWSLQLIIGEDQLLEAHKWKRFDTLCHMTPPLILKRTSFSADSSHAQSNIALLPSLSSTEIRQKLAQEQWDELHHLVPHRVIKYIRTHRLYLSPLPPSKTS